MDTIYLAEVAENTLRAVMQHYASPQAFRTLPIFDRSSNNYLLMDEGWEKYRRIHRVWAHIEIRDGKFWIHEDGTEEGIANLLLQAGIAQDRILLALDAPHLRNESELAAA